MKKIIILLFIVLAVAAGIYFKDYVVDFYSNLNTQIKNFQESDIGNTVAEAGKQIFTPSPLNIGGSFKNVVLTKSKVIEETNLQRQNNGLSSLAENSFLDKAALAKANDMFKNQYFEHVSPLGINPGELVSSSGYEYIIAGENLILGNFSSEKDVVENWMQSPGHKENILNSRFSEIGVAIIKGEYNGETVWIGVQEFGLPQSACSQPSSSLKSQIDIDKEHLDSLSLEIDQRKQQIENTNPRSAVYQQMVEDYNQLIGQYNFLAEQTKTEINQYNNQVNIFNNCVAGE